MNDPDRQQPDYTVTLAMLISESAYRVILFVDRRIRWFNLAVLRPLRLFL